jgi:hypothetical protein
VSAHISAGERISVFGNLFVLAEEILKLEMGFAWSYSRCHAARVVFTVSRMNKLIYVSSPKQN